MPKEVIPGIMTNLYPINQLMGQDPINFNQNLQRMKDLTDSIESDFAESLERIISKPPLDENQKRYNKKINRISPNKLEICPQTDTIHKFLSNDVITDNNIIVHAKKKEFRQDQISPTFMHAETSEFRNNHKDHIASRTKDDCCHKVQRAIVRSEASRIAAEIVASTEAIAAAAADAAAADKANTTNHSLNDVSMTKAARETFSSNTTLIANAAAAATAADSAHGVAADNAATNNTIHTTTTKIYVDIDRYLAERQITSTPHLGMIAGKLADDQDMYEMQKQYEQIIPIDPLNAQDLRATSSSIKKQLDIIQHECISNLIHHKKSCVIPYRKLFEEQSNFSPLFYASYVIQNPDTRNAFICKPCDKEGIMRHNFRAHHKTNKHLSNLEEWLDSMEQGDQEQPLPKKPKLVSFGKEEIENARYAIYTHRHASTLKENHLEQKSNNSMNQKLVFVNDDPVLKDNKMDIADQKLQDNWIAFTRAITVVETTFPVMFQQEVKSFVAALFFKQELHSIKLLFSKNLYDEEEPNRHWIAQKFDEMRQLSDARLYLQDKHQHNDFDFVHKSLEQKYEIRSISNMAKLLFTTLIDCKFVPTTYLILLSTIMYGHNNPHYPERAATLCNGQYMDLLLNTGIVIFREIPDQTKETKDPMKEMGINFAQLSHNQAQSSLGQKQQQDQPSAWLPPHTQFAHQQYTWPRLPPSWSSTHEKEYKEMFKSRESSQTFLNDCQENIDDDEIFMQTPLQDDINILHRPQKYQYNPEGNEETSLLGFSPYSSDTSSTDVPSLDSDIQENHISNDINTQENLSIDETRADMTISKANSSEFDIEGRYWVKPLFLKVLRKVTGVDQTQIAFSYRDVTLYLSKYILDNKDKFFDTCNIKIAHVENDPLGIAFNVKVFHRNQVTKLLQDQLIPFIDDTTTQNTVKNPLDLSSMLEVQIQEGETHTGSLMNSKNQKIHASAPIRSSKTKKSRRQKSRLLRNRQKVGKIGENSIENKNHPIIVANSLFSHWIDKHNYYQNSKEDITGKFASDIISELAILVTNK